MISRLIRPRSLFRVRRLVPDAAMLVLAVAGLIGTPALAQTKQPAKTTAVKTKTTAAKADAGSGQDATHQAYLLGKSGDWGAYMAKDGDEKVCYAMTQPKDRLPKGLNRDPAFLFIATRPSEGVHDEIAFVMGFPMKDGVDGQAVLGSATVPLVTKGAKAWLRNPADEARVVDSWKSSLDKLLIKVKSLRGHDLTDEYSLSGLTDALKSVHKECP